MGASPGEVRSVKALNCPSCGAQLVLRTFEHALSVVCERCLSVLDAKHPSLRVLQEAQAAERFAPLIPLGTRGKLHGDPYEVVGYQRRSILVEGEIYTWSEYLLFNPYKGFRFLTEYNGHWNDVKVLRSVPQQASSGGKLAVQFLGETYKHFQTARADTTYVLGEFPWQVRVGDSATVMDFVSPPRILSSEITEGEVTWSLGEYLTGERVWEIFQLRGSPPRAAGVFANQPSPYKGKVRGLWTACLFLLAFLFVFWQLFALITRQEEVFAGRYSFRAGMPGETSFVTDVFELKGRTSNVELSIRTDLANNWAYFNFALINEATGEAYDFGREVSYYYGRDSDGTWTEGSTGDRAFVPSVPPGRYYLRVEPEMAPGARAMEYTLRLRRDVPQYSFFLIAAVLLAAPPAFYSWRAFSFERTRWQESDYASSSGEDDDE